MKPHNNGINILGYTEAMSGLGEAVRLNILAIKKYNIPTNIINFEKVKHNKSYNYNLEYNINLVQVALHDLDCFFSVIDPAFFNNKYCILFVVWESEFIPENIEKNVNLFNEIWTASGYCNQLFKKTFSGPIITVPHPVEVNLEPIQNQNKVSLFDKNKFSFLFIFNYHSSIERKNPFFLIDAFSKAFTDDDKVELIIKTSGAEKFKKYEKKLRLLAYSKCNVKIINNEMDKNSVNHLINNCDAYVSLHHSEGFGLTLAEAMYLGKPTIGTNYSGNTEFMNEDNSFLVEYEIGYLKNPDNNFSDKTVWANPILNDAINKLKQVYDNRLLRNKKAKNGKTYIKNKLSFDSVGSIMRDRIAYLNENLDDLLMNNKQNTYLLKQLRLAKSEVTQLRNEVRRMKKNVIISLILDLKKVVRIVKGKK